MQLVQLYQGWNSVYTCNKACNYITITLSQPAHTKSVKAKLYTEYMFECIQICLGINLYGIR